MQDIPKHSRLLVTGIFRSGTTLLTRMLSAHPQVEVFYQPITALFKKWRELYYERMQCLPGTVPMGLDYWTSRERKNFFKTAGDLVFEKDELTAVVSEIRNSYGDDQNEKDSLLIDLLHDITPGTAMEILNQFYTFVHRAYYDIKTIGIKEVWIEEFVPIISNLACCIHIIRDPRAVCASRNTGRYLAACGGKKYPIVFIANTWKRSVQYLNILKRYQGYISLRYEDLIKYPEATARKITNFLGISFCIDMITPNRFHDARGKLWVPNSTFCYELEFNKGPLDYWQSNLSKEEIAIIEHLCCKEMDQTGYERVSTMNTQEVDNYTENYDDIVEWLRKPEFIFNRNYLWN